MPRARTQRFAKRQLLPGRQPSRPLNKRFPPRDRREFNLGCLDKDTNSNEAVAVSRITQNDQIGLLEPRVGT
jgi:hypothetical protein